MAYLSGAPLKKEALKKAIPEFEKEIDTIDKQLPKLSRFILPQGSEATSRLHIARAMIRSAERSTVYFISQKLEQTDQDQLIVQYLNRLSDLFFMLARKFSGEEKTT
jgi:cob(I)alamin adenosyltransferase